MIVAVQHPMRLRQSLFQAGKKRRITAGVQFGYQNSASISIYGIASCAARRREKVDLPLPLVPTTLIFIRRS